MGTENLGDVGRQHLYIHCRSAIMGPPVEWEIMHVFNRPGVAGAVLQTPLSLNNSVSDGL